MVVCVQNFVKKQKTGQLHVVTKIEVTFAASLKEGRKYLAACICFMERRSVHL